MLSALAVRHNHHPAFAPHAAGKKRQVQNVITDPPSDAWHAQAGWLANRFERVCQGYRVGARSARSSFAWACRPAPVTLKVRFLNLVPRFTSTVSMDGRLPRSASLARNDIRRPSISLRGASATKQSLSYRLRTCEMPYSPKKTISTAPLSIWNRTPANPIPPCLPIPPIPTSER